jgi:hypothetical protein
MSLLSYGKATLDVSLRRVSIFYSEAVDKFPEMRKLIIEKLLDAFGDVKSGKVSRGILWILGEYCQELPGLFIRLTGIRRVLTFRRNSAGDARVAQSHWRASYPGI